MMASVTAGASPTEEAGTKLRGITQGEIHKPVAASRHELVGAVDGGFQRFALTEVDALGGQRHKGLAVDQAAKGVLARLRGLGQRVHFFFLTTTDSQREQDNAQERLH